MILERAQLEVGPLLAEGGEGRVFELADRLGVLFKEYRNPMPLQRASALVDWPAGLGEATPRYAARVRAATAWPQGVVVEGDRAAGILVPRAPEPFWLRHRDGVARLATLSYLTADPDQRAAAYGLALPPPMAPERIALAYALARLLVALHGAASPAGHGDLSARNVLWSLDGAPGVYLIDCDNSQVGSETSEKPGRPDDPDRVAWRRPMTPNWDDPSIPPGANPDLLSDRYSLALIFLRVAGAAHYPIQRRQRRRETVAIDFDVPGAARYLPSLRRGAPLWAMCSAGLSLQRSGRPEPAAWAEVLEEVLRDMGTDLAERVRGAQDGSETGEGRPKSEWAAPVAVRDVVVRPVAATARTQAWRLASSRPAELEEQEEDPALKTQFRRQVRYAAVWWWIAHRRMVRMLVTRRSHLRGVRRMAFLALVDFALACAAIFLFAMIVSPFLGL